LNPGSAVEREPPPDIGRGPCIARGRVIGHLGQVRVELRAGEEMEKRMTDLEPVVSVHHQGIEVHEKTALRSVVGVPQADWGAFPRQGQPVR
jgi:hypothetical protein